MCKASEKPNIIELFRAAAILRQSQNSYDMRNKTLYFSFFIFHYSFSPATTTIRQPSATTMSWKTLSSQPLSRFLMPLGGCLPS